MFRGSSASVDFRLLRLKLKLHLTPSYALYALYCNQPGRGEGGGGFLTSRALCQADKSEVKYIITDLLQQMLRRMPTDLDGESHGKSHGKGGGVYGRLFGK